MLGTLHGYILRELLKSLALSVTALTVLFTLGGGLFNLVRFEGITAADVVGFLHYLIPIAVTLTLPLAALFSVTTVYGRLAADNELLACRAAGINVHRMFLAALLLSVFVAAFTLVFGNFVIPGMAQRLEDFGRNNLRDMALQKLQRDGFVQLRQREGTRGGERVTVTAEKVATTTEEKLRAGGYPVGPGLNYLVASQATLLHTDADGKLLRFIAAGQGVCLFDTSGESVRLTIYVHEGCDFEPGRRAAYVDKQPIGPVPVPMQPPLHFSLAPLDQLLYWRSNPWATPRLRPKLERFLADLGRERFEAYCTARLADGGALVLTTSAGQEYRVRAPRIEQGRRGLVLSGAAVEVYDAQRGQVTRYAPERVEIRAQPLVGRELLLELQLVRAARVDDPLARSQPDEQPPTLNLDGARVPAEVIAELAQFTVADVADPDAALPAHGTLLADARVGLQRAAAEVRRKIGSTIHFRLGLTSSVLVTVLMGAALGVVFRGARALAAFALAAVPLFSIWILLTLGRKVAEEPETAALGPVVTWGGLVLLLVADLIVIRAGVRR